MEIKDIKCTCTPEQREQAFKTIINDKVKMHLDSFDYQTKHLSDSEKMEVILKEIKAFEFVFSDDFLEPEHRKPRFFYSPYAYERGHANAWRDFKRNYEKRFGNEFRDFHLEFCPTLQPRTNEIGETYKPQNPNNKYLHPWFNYAYFFYLRLKDRAKGETKIDDKPHIQNLSSYLNCENKESVYKILVSNYSKAKSKKIALMLYALKQLDFIKISLTSTNKSELHRDLKNSLGDIGTPQGLTKQINLLVNDSEFNKNLIKMEAEFLVSKVSET
jgi:hypothetical protein